MSLREDDQFWDIFATPPCYGMTPWKDITPLDRAHLFLTFHWILENSELQADLYNILSQSEKHPHFEHYFAGEHACNVYLKKKLKAPKKVASKTVDVHFSFVRRMEILRSNSSRDKSVKSSRDMWLAKAEVEEVAMRRAFGGSAPVNKWLAETKEYSEAGSDCLKVMQQYTGWLLKVLQKHQPWITERLKIIQLQCMRPHARIDRVVSGFPLAGNGIRIGFEVRHLESEESFFWNVINLNLDWKQAMLGAGPQTQSITIVNLLDKNLKVSYVSGFHDQATLPDNRDGFRRKVSQLYLDSVDVVTPKTLQQDLFSVAPSTEKVDRAATGEKHFDSLSTNLNASFLRVRHAYIRDYWKWCIDHQELGSDAKEFVRDLEDFLENRREKIRQEANQTLATAVSDQWYSETLGAEQGSPEDGNEIASKEGAKEPPVKKPASQETPVREPPVKKRSARETPVREPLVTVPPPVAEEPSTLDWLMAMDWATVKQTTLDLYQRTKEYIETIKADDVLKYFQSQKD